MLPSERQSVLTFYTLPVKIRTPRLRSKVMGNLDLAGALRWSRRWNLMQVKPLTSDVRNPGRCVWGELGRVSPPQTGCRGPSVSFREQEPRQLCEGSGRRIWSPGGGRDSSEDPRCPQRVGPLWASGPQGERGVFGYFSFMGGERNHSPIPPHWLCAPG